MKINKDKSGLLITMPKGRRKKDEVFPRWCEFKEVSCYRYLGV